MICRIDCISLVYMYISLTLLWRTSYKSVVLLGFIVLISLSENILFIELLSYYDVTSILYDGFTLIYYLLGGGVEVPKSIYILSYILSRSEWWYISVFPSLYIGHKLGVWSATSSMLGVIFTLMSCLLYKLAV